MTLRETRRILLDGNVVDVVRRDDTLVAHDGREVAITDATHLSPVTPSKILCVGRNYRDHAAELGNGRESFHAIDHQILQDLNRLAGFAG